MSKIEVIFRGQKKTITHTLHLSTKTVSKMQESSLEWLRMKRHNNKRIEKVIHCQNVISGQNNYHVNFTDGSCADYKHTAPEYVMRFIANHNSKQVFASVTTVRTYYWIL